MTEAETKDQSALSVYLRLVRYTVPFWRVAVISGIALAVTAAVQTGFMSLMKPLIDGSFVDRDPKVIRLVPWAIVGLFLMRGLADFTATYGMAYIARHVVKALRGQLFEHLLWMPASFFDRTSSGLLVARLTFHVEQVADAATNAFSSIIKDGLTVIGLIGFLFWTNWRLAAFCMIVAPLIAMIIRYVSKRFRMVSRRIQDNMGVVTQTAEESVTGQRVIKVSNGQVYEAQRFAKVNERARFLAMKSVATKAGSDATIQFIAAWAIAAIVFFATRPEMLKEITPGTFVSFVGAMLGLMGPLKTLTQMNERLQRGISAASDVFQLMDLPVEPRGGALKLERARGALAFEDVSFAYAEGSPQVLKQINLQVKPGQTVAFVGKSGSGKSTLLALLPRFYDPGSGRIMLDGEPLDHYELASLRRQIALVDQQVRLFDATVAENIAYGLDPLPDAAAIERAARAAHAWEFIEKLPLGLDTPVGQNGAKLSGGQRQRIAIARALLRDAPILILDEATSALDTESERLIQAALDQLVVGRTTLVIAHRLSTIQSADLIVVMHEGRVIEQGHHEELLAKGGAYAALHRMQFEVAAG